MAQTTPTTKTRGLRRLQTGVVASNKAHKTCVVLIENRVKHPLYGKYVGSRTRLAVHDPENQAGIGDLVEVVQCRPISKTKRWRLVRVVKKAAMPQTIVTA